MTFAQPWWLVAGVIASLAILILHLFRPRRRTVRVSSLYLWREIEREVAFNKRRKRLLTSLLLLLQLLGVLVIAFALAGPRQGAVGRGYQLAVVVDTSASMGLFEPGGTRLELAVRRLERYLDSGEADRYSLWSAHQGELLYEGTSKSELLAAVRRVPEPTGVSDWTLTLRRVASLHAEATNLHAVIATDGALSVEDLSGLAEIGDEASVIRVGTPHGNLGITGFSARPVGGDPYVHQVLVTVSNLSGETQTAPIAIESDRPKTGDVNGRERITLRETELAIAAQASQRIVFEHRFRAGEVLTATLGVSDLFAADNLATIIAHPPGGTRILVVGGADYLLRQGFAVFPQVRISEALNPPSRGSQSAYDLTVFYDRPVPDDFMGDALVLTSGRNADPTAVQPEISWWNRAHPLSRFVDWDQVNIGPAAPLSVSPGESVLVETTLGPIVTLREELERRIVRVSIPLQRSDFPFKIAYPIFLHNLIDWTNPEGATLVPGPEQPGELPSQAAAALEQSGDAALHITAWENPEQSTAIGRTGAAALAAVLSRPGVYSWEAGERGGAFAVSLLDIGESDLTPRLGEWAAQGRVRLVTIEDQRLVDVERSFASNAEASRPVTHEFGSWVAAATLLALIILVAEGYLFIRTHGPARATGRASVLSRATPPPLRAGVPKGGAPR